MSRPLRLQYENAVYHVMNRGQGRGTIFPSALYKELFLKCLAEAVEQFGLEVLAYCLMGNHYHLLVRTPRANLARCMRHVNGLYTQRYNKLKKTDGPLFRGRYKAIVVDVDNYLLQVSRYIHRNPIETQKPLVNRLEDYVDSSYPAYINHVEAPKWLNRDLVLSALNSYKKYSAYQAFVQDEGDERVEQFYEKAHLPAVLGSQAFTQKVRKYVRASNKEVSLQRLSKPIEIAYIVEKVAQYFDISTDTILQVKRGAGRRNDARRLAMYLSKQYAGATLAQIAEHFGVGHYSTISQTIRRFIAQVEDNRKLAIAINVLSQDLTP